MDFALDTGVLWTFTLLWLAVVPTPGANSLMVTHVAMTRSPAHVAAAIAGNMGGILLLGAGALLGWAALLEAFPWLRLSVQVLGGVYLVYFGWRLVDRSRKPDAGPMASEATATESQVRLRKTLALGFVTALSNAQAIVFITSIFAVAGVLNAGVATGLACVAIMIACNASYLALLGWLFQRPAAHNVYRRFRRMLEGTMGVLFAVLGGRLLFRELVH